MPKVKNISNHLIPFLNKHLKKNFQDLRNFWYIDEMSCLYKIKIFEDGYPITSGSEYPENIEKLPEDKLYSRLDLFLKQVNRSSFVSENNSIFKFSFDNNSNIYHYILDSVVEKKEKFSDYQIDSKKRKRSYSEDYRTKEDDIDWTQMVSASRVRNYLLNDTLIDWLSEYNVTSINQNISTNLPNSSSLLDRFENNMVDEFTKHIMEQGNLFEKEVMKLLSSKHKVVQASESFQAREKRNFDYTVELMKEGVPIIYQAVLHNYENKTYGCPDLLVRSDYINKIFNQDIIEDSRTKCKNLILGVDYYYVVVEIKHSTLHFNVDFKTLRNRDSIPAYKGQLYIYNEALSKIQGYNLNKAFIIGKMWSWRERTGTNFLEKLGVVDFNDFDSNYVDQTQDAIKWVLRVRNEGNRWKLTPIPSIPELYPNMNNEKDGQWKSLKKELANKINEITCLWMCGIKNRLIAHGNNITSYKDEDCNSEALGFKKGNIYDTLNKIIDINRNEERIISPSKVKKRLICDKAWRSINEDSLEFYLDYETMNSNIGHVIIEDNNIGYEENQFIFQIGVGYIKNNKWTYKSFLAQTNNLLGELTMINNFWTYIDKVKKDENMEKEHFVHWYGAEPISYKKLQKRVETIGVKLREKNFLDLYKLFREEPITINGSLNFSLKSVAKAMNKNNLIKTDWNSNNPCSNGLNAMLLAHKVYSEGKGSVSEKNVIMNNIIHYNEVDCKVLWEILTYVRNNH